jgi:hypothetical protein
MEQLRVVLGIDQIISVEVGNWQILEAGLIEMQKLPHCGMECVFKGNRDWNFTDLFCKWIFS